MKSFSKTKAERLRREGLYLVPYTSVMLIVLAVLIASRSLLERSAEAHVQTTTPESKVDRVAGVAEPVPSVSSFPLVRTAGEVEELRTYARLINAHDLSLLVTVVGGVGDSSSDLIRRALEIDKALSSFGVSSSTAAVRVRPGRHRSSGRVEFSVMQGVVDESPLR